MNHCTGSIFDSKAIALVNPVNCYGVAGAGLAKEFKRRYPGNHKNYQAMCRTGSVRPGTPLICCYDPPLIIINFPTKDHWRDPSQLIWIADGLKYLERWYATLDPPSPSIAFPLLGCGLGGLDPVTVTWMIEGFASEVKAEVELWTKSTS